MKNSAKNLFEYLGVEQSFLPKAPQEPSSKSLLSSPLEVYLSDDRYSLRVDSNPRHFDKESSHWHLCYIGKPVAQITAYACWISFPKANEVPTEIRLEAEALTQEYRFEIMKACNQYPQAEQWLVEERVGKGFFAYNGCHRPTKVSL